MTPKKATKSPKKPSLDPDPDAIARLAYAYWEDRGRPDGSSEEDWLRAEEEVRRLQSEETTD